jgi:hypothetical protein
MDAQARRLQVLGGQLATSIAGDVRHELGRSEAAAHQELGECGYAVALPEKLTPDGPWNVYRCGAARRGARGCPAPAACA